MDFGEFLWLLFISFLFFMYLMALWTVLGDLFRDDSMSGWGKAAWLVFLLVLPFLSLLIYLIARGSGMGERAIQSATRAREQQLSYAKQIVADSPGSTVADEIGKAAALHEKGLISEDEFTAIKQRALAASV